VTRNLENIDLTRLEFLLLTCLARRAGRCVPRQALIEFIWRTIIQSARTPSMCW